MFQSILCPVDFSPQSRQALRYAAAAARRFGGRLTVLFVNDPLLLAAAETALRGRRRFVERTRAELARFAKHAMRGGSPPESVTTVVSVGNPAEEILRFARQHRNDLVVMGSHGLSGIPRMFFGSTTEQVLRTANVPVLAIPPSIRSRTPSGWLADVARVIAPIDLAGEWQSDAARAADIAGELQAELVLVHVLAKVQTPFWLPAIGRSHERRRLDHAARALERIRTKLFSGVPSMSTMVVAGNPAEEIARLTARRGALVVMSLRDAAGLWGVRRGSVAYHVLTRSSTPVLAMPRRRMGRRFATRARQAVGAVLTERERAGIAGMDALSPAAPSRPGAITR